MRPTRELSHADKYVEFLRVARRDMLKGGAVVEIDESPERSIIHTESTSIAIYYHAGRKYDNGLKNKIFRAFVQAGIGLE